MNIRTINKIINGQRTTDGAGVRLTRVLGRGDTKETDPFLMLDAFDSTNPEDYIKGFPWHPHRGIETITYLVSGRIEHGDSLGNHGAIVDGSCQWMTAGSGIVHQEMPKPSDRMLGVQIWLNLPAEYKMTPPAYGDIHSEDVPVVSDQGSEVRIIAGSCAGVEGAFEGRYVKATLLDIIVPPEQVWTYPCNKDHAVIAFALEGSGSCGADSDLSVIRKADAALFGAGDLFRIKTSTEGIRFLLMCGKPLREPIAWGGPIVMNTRAELELAFRELDEGTFIKAQK